MNPAGTHEYVANFNSGNVSVLDTATDTVVAAVAVGTGPYAFGRFIGPAATSETRIGAVPTLAEWSLIVLALLVAGFGLRGVWRSEPH